MAHDYSIHVSAKGVHGPKQKAYGKVKKDKKDVTAIPSGYTILGPDMLDTLCVQYEVTSDNELLTAMDVEDGITETP